jgi:lipid-binding SYLF domain-containing protein
MSARLLLGLAWMILPVQPVAADWQADPEDSLQVRTYEVVTAFKDRVPRTVPYFQQAYGFAVFPSVTRAGFGFGGAYGKGLVIEGEQAVGVTKYWQFTSGIQAGARNFAMIIFFKDKEALDYYRSGEIQFMGQAGLAVANLGIAGTPAYNEGVAVVTLTRFGLMGEFTVSGAKFSFKPLPRGR